jgi:hypothetical protein
MTGRDRDYPILMRRAFRYMLAIRKEQRSTIMAWFCDRCYGYIPPGKDCKCGKERQ